MENGGLRRSIVAMKQSFFDEGILDEQFTVLEQMQERCSPNFVQDVIGVYFGTSTGLLATIEQEMDTVPTDFSKMDRILYRLNGSSNCIGARKVENEINKTRQLLQERNLEGAKIAFQDLRNEHDILKSRLEPYCQQLTLQAQLTQQHHPGEAISPRR